MQQKGTDDSISASPSPSKTSSADHLCASSRCADVCNRKTQSDVNFLSDVLRSRAGRLAPAARAREEPPAALESPPVKAFARAAGSGERSASGEKAFVGSPTERPVRQSCVASEEIGAKTAREDSAASYATATHVEGGGMEQAGGEPSLAPRHWSLFYPRGIEAQPPALVHYLVLGGWRTIPGGWDYFLHRRLNAGDVIGHTVRWLHGAKPRDRFVFLIEPVMPKAKNEPVHIWQRMLNKLFGTPPAFAYSKGELRKHAAPPSSSSSSSSTVKRGSLFPEDGLPRQGDDLLHSYQSDHSSDMSMRSQTVGHGEKRRLRKTYGVEAIEIRHEDVTALDYGPRLLTSRFSIESKAVYAYYFSSVKEAYTYYDCLDDIQRVQDQEEQGIVKVVSSVQTAQTDVHTETKDAKNSCQAVNRWSGAGTASSASDTSFDFCDSDGPHHSEYYKQKNTLPPESSFSQGLPSDHSLRPQPAQASLAQPELPPYRARVFPELTTVHCDTILTVYTGDPNFNAILRELLMPEPGTHPYTVSVREQKRMLSMYETGMPAWTIFFSSTGLPYRRVFRLTFVGLLNIWPVISLFVGLYDLYKHLPQMKAFLSTTLAPLLEWIEEHVTFRVSMLVTYLLSVGLTVVASFTSFLSQFYLLEIGLIPLRMLAQLLHLPFALFIDIVWALFRTASSFLSLLWVTFKLIFAGPFLLVSHVGSLEFSGYGAAVLPAAAQGTSLSLKWWRAWQEFWVTVAAPVKNLAKAWYDSVLHVATKATQHETSIRRWFVPKLLTFLSFVDLLWEGCVMALQSLWQVLLSGHGQLFIHVVLLFICVWMLLPFSANQMAQRTEVGLGAAHAIVNVNQSKAVEWKPPPAQEKQLLLLPSPEPLSQSLQLSLKDKMVWGLVKDRVKALLNDFPGKGFDEYDDLYFAWETLFAIWIQLSW